METSNLPRIFWNSLLLFVIAACLTGFVAYGLADGQFPQFNSITIIAFCIAVGIERFITSVWIFIEIVTAPVYS